MHATKILAAKLSALRAVTRMIKWLKNWPAVWSSYRAGVVLPPLHFRDGFTLHHGQEDDPVMLLHEVFVGGCYRRHLPSTLEGTMVDLGSNIGAVTLDWTSRSTKLNVHAYEPNPRTYDVLSCNVAQNDLAGRVKAYKEAVGRESGELRLWTNGASVLTTGYGTASTAPVGTAVTVPMVDLNEVVTRVGEPVSLLKIDTEGAEADILEGANASTLSMVLRVILEYHDHLCPDALSRCRTVLERAGFECKVYAANPDQGLLYAWRSTL